LRGGLNSPMQSPNWSGFELSSNNGAFHSVSASWIQPKATCRSARVHAYAAFWAGLDGIPPSSTVEQTGTDSDCSGTTPTYYGWYEMFPVAPVFFRTRVRPGDHISASVTFSGTMAYTLVLSDSTQHWTRRIIRRAAGLDRSSAEVITEAPSSGLSVLPLADFGTVRYAGSRLNGVLLRGLGPTRIIMIASSGHQLDRTSPISSVDAFTNFWLKSN
jgi:hypothetical protein